MVSYVGRVLLDALTAFGLVFLALGIINMVAGHGVDLVVVAWVLLTPNAIRTIRTYRRWPTIRNLEER